MANLIDADLLLDTLSARVQTTLGSRLAPLSAFARDFSDAGLAAQTKYVQIPLVTAASAVQTTPTNFETGDTNTSNVGVLVSHYSKSFSLTSAEANQKLMLDMFLDKNIQVFANKILDVALTPVTNTLFSTQNIIVAQASMAAANLQTVWAGIANNDTKTVLLDAVAYSKLLPTSLTAVDVRDKGAYGFDSFHLNTRWTGAGANVYGFAAGPGAIAMVSGIPVKGGNGNGMISSRAVTLPGLGLTVELNTWFAPAGRVQWASLDVMFGASFGGDINAGYIIRSAAE